jgi:predicted nucleic acid-binding protein
MTTKPGLLDINVLIALIDPAHQFHGSAHRWFKSHRRHGWATCPITENGCLRIMSKPGYPFPGLTVELVRGILTELIRVEGHRFWADSLSLIEGAGRVEPKRFDFSQTGPKHLTDLYLLSLAIANRGRLVTFDRTIPVGAIVDLGPDDMQVLTEDYVE